MSCSENGNKIARGVAECYFAVIATSGIYPKISLLPVLSQIKTIASFVKVKISDFFFKIASTMSSGFLLHPECIGRRLIHFPAE